jgi:hypothetical protein
MKKQIWLFSLLFLMSCAQHRPVTRPNYSLKREAARQEVDRFTMWSKPFVSLRSNFEMGPKARSYPAEDLFEMIQEVSPTSQKSIDRFKKWQHRKWLVVTFAGVLWGLGTINPKDSQKNQMQMLGYALGLYGLGIHLYQIHQLRKIPDRYNKDLNQRFFPSVSWTTNF